VRQVATFVISFLLAWVFNTGETGIVGFVALAVIAGGITWLCEILNGWRPRPGE
jgi:hypothetical protein